MFELRIYSKKVDKILTKFVYFIPSAWNLYEESVEDKEIKYSDYFTKYIFKLNDNVPEFIDCNV